MLFGHQTTKIVGSVLKDAETTLFSPNFFNKTTLVAMNYHILPQPYYLIMKTAKW
jgi:hypothetical protein